MHNLHAGQPALIIGNAIQRHSLPEQFSAFGGITIGVDNWHQKKPFEGGKWWPHYWLIWSYKYIQNIFSKHYPRFSGTVLYYGIGTNKQEEAREAELRKLAGLKTALINSPNSHGNRSTYRQFLHTSEYPAPKNSIEEAICVARFMGCFPVYVMSGGRVLKKYGCEKLK